MSDEECFNICSNGDLAALKSFIKKYKYVCGAGIVTAVESGHLELSKFLYVNYYFMIKNWLLFAHTNGTLEFEHFVENQNDITANMEKKSLFYDGVLENCTKKMDLVKRVLPTWLVNISVYAKKKGLVEIQKYLLQRFTKVSPSVWHYLGLLDKCEVIENTNKEFVRACKTADLELLSRIKHFTVLDMVKGMKKAEQSDNAQGVLCFIDRKFSNLIN